MYIAQPGQPSQPAEMVSQTHPGQSWYSTGAWLLVRGSWILASGSWLLLAPAFAPGFLVPRFSFLASASRVLAPFYNEGPGCTKCSTSYPGSH